MTAATRGRKCRRSSRRPARSGGPCPAVQPRRAGPRGLDLRRPFALTIPAVPDVRSSIKDPDGAGSMLFQSVDEGTTWRSLGDAAHSPSAARLTAVAADPANAGGVIVGTETGEVWRVSPEATWAQLLAGLPPGQALLPVR